MWCLRIPRRGAKLNAVNVHAELSCAGDVSTSALDVKCFPLSQGREVPLPARPFPLAAAAAR